MSEIWIVEAPSYWEWPQGMSSQALYWHFLWLVLEGVNSEPEPEKINNGLQYFPPVSEFLKMMISVVKIQVKYELQLAFSYSI